MHTITKFNWSEKRFELFVKAQCELADVVAAGRALIHDNLYDCVNDISARYQAGRLSDVTYQNQLARLQCQADLQISQLEASYAQHINTLNNTFNS